MLDYYLPIARDQVLEIESLAKELKNIKILHINTTFRGGGVAEILSRLVPLMNSIGIKTDWKIFKGTQEFFKLTKKIHNLLHLATDYSMPKEEVELYLKTTYENFSIDTENYDVIFVHDPQPIGMIKKKVSGQKWIWRCHIDTSNPTISIWEFLEGFLKEYNAAVFHLEEFIYRKLPIQSFVIMPSIDPLSDKNKDLEQSFIKETVSKYGIRIGVPLLLQVSRFDRLKDPLGVVSTYKMVRKKIECQLVLLGSYADDDPEGEEVYNEVLENVGDDKNVFILNLPPDSHLEVNAFQRFADVVFQKSIREGFALTCSEALYKEKPVIGGNTGGIKKQIIDSYNGYLVNSIEEAASRCEFLLTNPDLRKKMGINGKEIVKKNFLITRQLRDYLQLVKNVLSY